MIPWYGLLFCLFLGSLTADEGLKPSVTPNELVAEALATEATWQAFPGFVADVEVHHDGKASHGRIIVEADGRVFAEHLPPAHRTWVIAQLGCIVQQRLSREENANPTWVFVEDRERGALLRQAVCRSDAPFGPFLWIENRQLRAVESRSVRHRQRLTTVSVDLNPDNKHLPTTLVAHRWNTRTRALETTETTLLSWRRVGSFDLPATVHVLSAGASIEPAAPTIRSVVLTGHRLLGFAEPLRASRQ